jgi:hypothetical protein
MKFLGCLRMLPENRSESDRCCYPLLLRFIVFIPTVEQFLLKAISFMTNGRRS